MLEDPKCCYDPGYAAGATMRRAGAAHTETVCEQGLKIRLEGWSARHFLNFPEVDASYRIACGDYFGRGFRDGYWGRARRAAGALSRVA